MRKRERMMWPFKVGEVYNRRADIHAAFGGQQQGGIATPKAVPGIFLFTGSGGAKVGYDDHHLPDGSFRYTGEGQVGTMHMSHGNLAIRDHALNGKDLLIFKKGGSGQPVGYLGLYVCAGWEWESQPDSLGNPRPEIVFNLLPAEAVIERLADDDEVAPVGGDLDLLRTRALEAASVGLSKSGVSPKTFYKRSVAVRIYVLARAKGACEACGLPAPFRRPSGAPYLEPHHIRRVSDGGPDHPKFVAAVCPNCHRRAHSGDDQESFKQSLLEKVGALEAK